MNEVTQYIGGLEKRISALNAEVVKMSQIRVCLGTNEGTFGPDECARKVGTGDPAFGNYTLWETVGGAKITEDCDPEKAPGTFRRNANAHRELAELRREQKEKEKSTKAIVDEIREEIVNTRKLGMLTTGQVARR